MRSYRLLRRFFAVALVVATQTFTTGFAQAVEPADAAWPTHALKLIVPFPPGGAADLIGRYYAEQLGQALGQPVVIENRPGAGTAIAAETAARAAADGYTLSLATSGQLTILPSLNGQLRFDPVKDFQPVSLLASVPNVVAVNASNTDIRSLHQLIDAARANPGKISYSSCGMGTLCHLSGELLQNLTGIKLLHVPYKGSAQAVSDLLGGQVQVSVDTLTILAPHIRAGKLRGLVVGAPERSPLIPDVPSANAADLPGFIASGWFGLVVPSGTPQPIVQRLHQAIERIATSQETEKIFGENGITVEHNTPQQFARLIQDDLLRWQQVIDTAKVPKVGY